MVDWLMENDYFAAPPPKSTGRELFGEEFAYLLRDLRKLKGRDMLATMCAFTARSIGQAFRDFLEPRGGVQTVVVGGGGSHNKTLMRMLAEELPGARITTHAEFGLPDDAKEAAAFALLGYETLHGRPSNVPSATGARRPAVLGSVTPA
jgi:anhydro-N-acetylmuramic acid kinase